MKEPQESSIREAWVLCLILGLIMINFPFIHIFNTARPIFGIPKLILYFFIGWPVSIIVIAVFVHYSKKHQRETPDEAEDHNES